MDSDVCGSCGSGRNSRNSCINALLCANRPYVDELTNPYWPGAGLPPPALIGRDALLHSFRTATARALAGKPGKSVMPAGLRGVGKTVLLRQCANIAEPQGYLVANIEAPETGEFRRVLANRIRRALVDLSEGPATPRSWSAQGFRSYRSSPARPNPTRNGCSRSLASARCRSRMRTRPSLSLRSR
jgi:hypothetical protein